MKIKCKYCKEIIKGDGKGTFISCECERTAIKETLFYYATYGDNWKEIKDERYNKSIRSTKRGQTFFGINRRYNKKLYSR